MQQGERTFPAERLAPLFQPLAIRGLTLPHRFAMSPMTRGFCPSGAPGDDVREYYERRADADVGLIITEAISTDHPVSSGISAIGEKDLPMIHTSEAFEGWKQIVESVHARGAKIMPQFWHQGAMRMPNGEAPSFSPAGIYGPTDRLTSIKPEKQAILDRPLPVPSDEEVADVVASFGRAAAAAKAAGFDGIALHGAHGYLIDAFLWDETNLRNDRWGGDSVCRTRFAVEVVKAVRAAVGEELPIFFRFSQWKQQDFKAKLAQTPKDLERILGPISDAGVDLFEASVRYFNTPAFEGSDRTLAGWAKTLTGKQSAIVGGIGLGKGLFDTWTGGTEAVDNLGVLLDRFERGEFDLALVGRALMNDPAWTARVRAGAPFKAFDSASNYQLM